MAVEDRRVLQALRALPAGAVAVARLGDDPRVHAIGGAVRDLLLNRPPRELDLVVEGDAPAVARALDPSARVHERFGTATVAVDGVSFDLASTRVERYERPGVLPTVMRRGVPLTDDLPRRDFTVNAIAVRLCDGAVTALPGALEDLRARVLRVLHDRSFVDDPTRVLRLARYAARLGFTVESHTRELALAADRSTVSRARIDNELRLLAAELDPGAAFAALDDLGMRASGEGAARAARLVPPDADRVRAVLHGALHEPLQLPSGPPSAVARAVGRRPVEEVCSALPEDVATRWIGEWRHVKSSITAADLLAAGVPRGPALARGLEAARLAALDGRDELAAALAA